LAAIAVFEKRERSVDTASLEKCILAFFCPFA
jgi:hypothetical protein